MMEGGYAYKVPGDKNIKGVEGCVDSCLVGEDKKGVGYNQVSSTKWRQKLNDQRHYHAYSIISLRIYTILKKKEDENQDGKELILLK